MEAVKLANDMTPQETLKLIIEAEEKANVSDADCEFYFPLATTGGCGTCGVSNQLHGEKTTKVFKGHVFIQELQKHLT